MTVLKGRIGIDPAQIPQADRYGILCLFAVTSSLTPEWFAFLARREFTKAARETLAMPGSSDNVPFCVVLCDN